MAKLHLRATYTATPDKLPTDFRPVPKAWREKYSDEFLTLAADLLATYDYGLVLWKIRNHHPTIWANRVRRLGPVRHLTPEQVQNMQQPSLELATEMLFDPWKPKVPVQQSLGLEEPDDPIRPDVPKPLRISPRRKR
jgi:hypothetical protein